uniref:26S proteasome non-ATPase regulatory subunit 5 n=1 Tax=Lygus hesperus TaxID=30085 RepID=A0A0A9Y3S5_LYGHE
MTADTQSVVSSLISNIKNDVAVETNLSELKLVVSALNSSELKNQSSNIPLSVIFDCLNSQNESQIKNGCDVLNLILPTYSSSAVLLKNDVAQPLARCLNHPHPEVKKMALRELKRHINGDEMTFFLGNNNRKKTMLSIIDCLCDEETSVGLEATSLLSSLGQSKTGPRVLCQPDIAEVAIEKTKFSDTNRIRLYQALVEISLTSGDYLRQIESQGYFRDLVSCIKTDDVLANLTILEVITPLALRWHGFEFLSRHGIVKFLVDVLATADTHPLKSLFYPGVVRFFGNLGQKYSQQLASDYPTVISKIFEMTESIEESIFITSLETIGMIAYSRSGKNLLMTEPSMSACMKRVYAAITQVPSDWRVRGLNALSSIIHVEPSDTKSDFAAVAQAWFEEMGPQGFETVSDMARQPFPDIKCGALEVLIQLATMKWGQTKIASNQALVDYLLGTSEEPNSDARASKLRLLKVLAESETSPSVFGEDVLNKIKSGADEVKSNGDAVVLVDMMSV